MTFHVGQKVVCVEAQHTQDDDFRELVEGAVYTISWLGMFEAMFCMRLAEIPVRAERVRPYDNVALQMPFRADRFRPLIERKTDTGMAMLKEILDRETVGDRTHVPKKAGVA